MEYVLTGFSPAVDAFAFSNAGWSIDEDEASVILDVVKKAAIAALMVRPPLLDAVFDTILLAGPFLAIPRVQDQLIKWLANNGTLDAAEPAFCCGMCFCALDAYSARVPSSRGVFGIPPTRHGTPQEAALRKVLLERHLDAWKAGAAWTSVETKIIQRTQGVNAIRKRSARDVARLVASLRSDVPLPVLIHQNDSDPFSSHCLVAYGAVVHPQVGDAQEIELYVYDPNQPILHDPRQASGSSPEATLKITLEGGLAAPRSVREIVLSGSGWDLVGLSLTPYTPAAPSPSLVEASAAATLSGHAVKVAFQIANVGTGEIGPFVVGARSTAVIAAPGTRDDWPHAVIKKPKPGGGVRTVDGPTVTTDTVVVRVPPTFIVKDGIPNLPQLVAPGTSAGAEVSFATASDVIRVTSVLAFVWRSKIATLRDPSLVWNRTYERRAPGAGVMVRPPAGTGLV